MKTHSWQGAFTLLEVSISMLVGAIFMLAATQVFLQENAWRQQVAATHRHLETVATVRRVLGADMRRALLAGMSDRADITSFLPSNVPRPGLATRDTAVLVLPRFDVAGQLLTERSHYFIGQPSDRTLPTGLYRRIQRADGSFAPSEEVVSGVADLQVAFCYETCAQNQNWQAAALTGYQVHFRLVQTSHNDMREYVMTIAAHRNTWQEPQP